MAFDSESFMSSVTQVFGPVFARYGFLNKNYTSRGSSDVYLFSSAIAVDKLRDRLKGEGHKIRGYAGRDKKETDKLSYRLMRREDVPVLFAVAESGVVGDFPNKRSVFRVGAQRVSKDFVSRFDTYVYNEDIRWSRGRGMRGFDVDEFSLILEEVRKYAVKLLESVEVEPSMANVADLLELMHMKTYRVVTECFKAMPYLKVDREIDKNLARLVGSGVNYHRLLIFNVAEFYPGSLEEFKQFVQAPDEWLVALSF